MKSALIFSVVGLTQASLLNNPTIVADASKAPVVAKVAMKHATITEAQKKTMHFGCVSACKPSPVESKCVTACEAAMYKCIDETGPNEDEKDTKACHDKTLKLYEETKGLPKKEGNATGNATKGEAKKEEKKAEKKAKMFLQLQDEDDTDEGDDSAVALDGEDGSEEGSEDDSADAEVDDEEPAVEDESLIQVSKKNIDDDNAEAAEMAKMEDETDKLEGEDSDDSASSGGDEEEGEIDESLLQTSKNIDDDNAEAAEMAKMEDETDKLEGEDSDDSASSGGDEEEGEADESFVQTKKSKTQWKPEPCDELEPGVPCTHLYEHPQGSTVVMPCPVERQTAPESCRALFGDKADGQQCPQITCPKALGVTMKLVCGGGCCPSCWAPDHVVKLDRHTTVDDAAVVDPAPQAPGTCSGVKCFELNCAPGFTKGHVNGDCCYSCVQGR